MKRLVILSLLCVIWITVSSLSIGKNKNNADPEESVEENRGLVQDFDEERKIVVIVINFNYTISF